MKNLKSLFGLATAVATVLSFTSCSSEELPSQNDPQKAGNEISFIYRAASTRTVVDPQPNTTIATDLNVGIFGVSSEATTTMKNYNNNKYVTATAGAINLAEGFSAMTWPTTSEATASLYAYAPYNSAWTVDAANAFSVNSDQSTDANYLASDLLYAAAASQAQGSTVALAFSHKLSKINITIKKETGSNVNLAGATVKIINTKLTTSLNPSTGELGAASGDATDILAATIASDLTAGDESSTATACAVVVPQALTANTGLVKIVASDSRTFIGKLSAAATLSSGNSYNMTISVGTATAPVVEVPITLGSTSLVAWTDNAIGAVTEEVMPTATFGTPGGNASYDTSTNTYTWTGTTNNLMTCFEFSNGELANYKTLKFKLSDISGGMVRIGYYVGSEWTEMGNGYASAGEKTIDLTALGIDLSTVTKISFGGKTLNDSSIPGSAVIKASEMILSND